MLSRVSILIAILALLVLVDAQGRDLAVHPVIGRMLGYRATVDATPEGHQTTAYMKYQVKTEQRNVLLLTVPQMYNFAQDDRREIVGEYVVALTYHTGAPSDARLIARTSTIRRHRTMVPDIYQFLTPDIYHTTLFHDRLLSPFHPSNRRYYRYEVSEVAGGQARIEILRKVPNTQTVCGHAIVDISSGQVLSCTLSGEYDVIVFELSLVMGQEGLGSLLPVSSKLKAKFSLLGNRLRGVYETTYDVADSLSSTDSEEESRQLISRIRPDSLTSLQARIYFTDDSLSEARRKRREERAKLPPQRKPLRDVLWNVVGENLIHRIRGNFGKEDRGYYRFSPIVNPLYISYSRRKGWSYRFKARMGYDFSDNMEISTRSKIGYFFKYHQLLTDIPVTFDFDKRNNGYVKLRWTSGDLVTNSTIIDKLKEEYGDSDRWENNDLDYFKHYKTELTAHYDFTRHFGLEAGLLFKRWSSVHKKGFELLDKPTSYHATSWKVAGTLRPIGWKGPVVTINYEHTMPRFSKERMTYVKWEGDCSYIHELSRLRSLSMRLGAGIYTSKREKTYFLDFDNFRDDNIPGGWNDEWSGEFELLHRSWYNSSQYYIRMNATYESPMLLLSWIPLVGNLMEKERFYLSALKLEDLSHYIEFGYGFTNQFFSIGLFTSFNRGAYHSFGCKIEFELFNGW